MGDSDELVRQLRATLARLELALGAISDAILWTDPEGRVQWCNAALTRLAERPHIDVLGTKLPELLRLERGGKALEGSDSPLEGALHGKAGTQRCDLVVQGRRLPIEIEAHSAVLGGQDAATVFVIRDITERLDSEEKLKTAKRALEVAYDRLHLDYVLSRQALALDDDKEFWPQLAKRIARFFHCDRITIFQCDTQGGLVSRFAAGLSEPLIIPPGRGIAGHVAISGACYMTNAARADPRFDGEVDRLTSYESRNILAYPLTHKDRTVGVVELINKEGDFGREDLEAMEYFGPRIAIFFVKFRSEERQQQLASEMMQMEKLAAVGRLASGVAHEINNPLSAILGLTQLMGRLYASPPELLEDLLKIDAEARRIKTIVQNLLGYSRTSRAAFSSVTMSEILEGTLPLLQHELRHRQVEIVTDFEPGLPMVQASSSQLKQVFVNLVLNALHALEGRPKGRIRLTARANRASGWVHAEVEDNGPGIPAEFRERLFEPFFTTKEPGQGTGLGLYVCMGIVERHGGMISLESEVDRGTTFRVSLPIPPGT